MFCPVLSASRDAAKKAAVLLYSPETDTFLEDTIRNAAMRDQQLRKVRAYPNLRKAKCDRLQAIGVLSEREPILRLTRLILDFE